MDQGTLPSELSGGRKYKGEIAAGYDAKRESQSKWHEENRIMRDWLSAFPKGTSVVDVPVGTGRFIPLYEELGFNVLGLDISEDMLKEASEKAKGDNTYLRLGDARDIDLSDQGYDVAVCIRLFRWIKLYEVQYVLRELQRVARKNIIFNARVANHPYARPMSLMFSAVHDPWKVAKTKVIEPNYMMFMLERVKT